MDAGFDAAHGTRGWPRWTAALQMVVVFLIAGVLILLYEPQHSLRKREITLHTEAVPLAASGPRAEHVGALEYKGGFAINSDDKDFGGLSALMIEDGADDAASRVIALSDEGDRFEAHLRIDDDRLVGLDQATLEPLVDLDGMPVKTKGWGDAESLARLPDGRTLVGFERHHRIWSYGPRVSGNARTFESPQALQHAPPNGGLESIAAFDDGRVLAITERLKTRGPNCAAFLFSRGVWSDLEWKPSAPGFEPSDAAVLPDGDVLVLERMWSTLGPANFSSRLVRVKARSIMRGAVLAGPVIAELKAPLISENFEGVAISRSPAGAVRLFLVSDDNLLKLQRTLLLMFELREQTAVASRP